MPRQDFATDEEGATIGLAEESPVQERALNTRKMLGEGTLDTEKRHIDVMQVD